MQTSTCLFQYNNFTSTKISRQTKLRDDEVCQILNVRLNSSQEKPLCTLYSNMVDVPMVGADMQRIYTGSPADRETLLAFAVCTEQMNEVYPQVVDINNGNYSTDNNASNTN